MKHTRRVLLASAALTLAMTATTTLRAAEPMDVVASFSILGDMVSTVGGERVRVETLVGPGEDAHVFDPAPADARLLADADLVVLNGLGFEGWIDRLVEASGYDGAIVVASAGIDPLPSEPEDHHGEGEAHDEHADDDAHADHDDHEEHAGEEGHEEDDHHHGAFDPHAWQDLANGAVYVRNIAAALSLADPEGAAIYEANAQAYLGEIEALDRMVREAMDALPADARTIVTSHDAFGYFGHAYGIVFLAPEGMNTADEPSAAEIAALIDQIEREHIAGLFVENISDNRVLERIAEDTGVVIGGTLYSDSLSGPEGPAATYLAMMRNNTSQLSSALQAF
jgi:zinc/manganese transport system substrate-binding protein